MKKKIVIVIAAAVLLFTCVIGGTFAWLVDKTATVTNVFTVGDINIELNESANLDLKMMPGKAITKDAQVVVKANSEECWLFVKVEKKNAVDNYLTYSIDTGWTALTDGTDGIYYREVAGANTSQHFFVLKDKQVVVKETVTKADLEAVAADTSRIQLNFTAYAIQKEGVTTAADAWSKINAQ